VAQRTLTPLSVVQHMQQHWQADTFLQSRVLGNKYLTRLQQQAFLGQMARLVLAGFWSLQRQAACTAWL
jgi:hypothetical protein